MAPVGVLMVGAGEYTAGYVPTQHGAASDKPAGVVALTCFDLRRQGLVGRMVLCDRVGTRLPAVRATLKAKIGDVYKGLDLSLECFPSDDVEVDDAAYLKAMASMQRGDVCIIFTPDDTHYDIASAAVRHGLHVLLAKPAVQRLEQHLALSQQAGAEGVLVAVEFHKRFDPIYSDARCRAAALGPFSHFSSYMAQPKQQLDTFRGWAGKSSDISYYLNSHHVDIHSWMVGASCRPVRVVAMAARGVAEAKLGRPCEDTITLMTQWESTPAPEAARQGGQQGQGAGEGAAGQQQESKGPRHVGTALYTSSWVAAKGDCHTQQYFHYMGQGGEVRVDQAHRGYSSSTDGGGYASLNPLYMRYVPDAAGHFQGQGGYGYVSIARFVQAVASLNAGTVSLSDLRAEGQLALIDTTARVTAILEAGRLSLDQKGAAVEISYSDAAAGGAASDVAEGAVEQPCGLRVVTA